MYQGGELVGHVREYSDTLGIFLLKSRRRQIYGERREIEHSGSLEHRIAQMSPEQRLARLRELQAKAALVIDGEAEEVIEGEADEGEEDRTRVHRLPRADRAIS